MKKELTQQALERFLEQMKEIQEQHPRAEVTLDLERVQIVIAYSPPRDLLQRKNIKFKGENQNL